MARLNDAPVPAPAQAVRAFEESTESLEAVKRILMRQNRQIARSHSAQSLQIRTLTTQISTLIATNVALREENIRLRAQLGRAQDVTFKSGIENVKDTLTAQLKSMAALIDQIEVQVRPPSPQASPETRKSMCLESMQFRDRPSLREVMDEMPAIQEMSALLEAESMARLSDASVESADLGPPPVSRVNLVDAVTDIDIVHASINIEARRKRKESISGQARRRSTMLAPMLSPERPPAKRKMADREDLKENDDFQFTRRNTVGAVELAAVSKPERRVLGAKSTNISPKKQRVEIREDIKAEKDIVRSDRRRSRRPAVAEVHLDDDDSAPKQESIGRRRHTTRPSRLSMTQPDQTVEDVAFGARHIQSATSLVPDTGQPRSTTTNPSQPFDCPTIGLNADAIVAVASPVTTSTTDDARPSRRARATVNYAEPSLVAKMRRPGKEMLDALSGLQDPRDAISTARRAKPSLETKAQNQRSPIVRKTDEDDDVLSPIDEPIETSLSLASLITGETLSQQAIDHALDVYNFDDSPPHSPVRIIKARRHSTTVKVVPDVVVKQPSVMATTAAIRRRSMMV